MPARAVGRQTGAPGGGKRGGKRAAACPAIAALTATAQGSKPEEIPVLCRAAPPRPRRRKESMMPTFPSLTGPRSHVGIMSDPRARAQSWEHIENKRPEEQFFSRQS